jgi:hypothetical protein
MAVAAISPDPNTGLTDWMKAAYSPKFFFVMPRARVELANRR